MKDAQPRGLQHWEKSSSWIIMSQLSASRLFALLGALGAIIWTWSEGFKSEADQKPPPIPGRNNTVLFLTTDLRGLANVHIATSFTLLENYPSIEVHFASFSTLQNEIESTSSSAMVRSPSASAIQWHGVSGRSCKEAFLIRVSDNLTEFAGVRGMRKKESDLAAGMYPYSNDEHWAIYKQLYDIVEEVDPSLVVMDQLFRPALDLAINVNRRYMTISPNSLLDLIPNKQPWGKMFWKYPGPASGYPYPVPWYLIPANLYISVRIMVSVLSTALAAQIDAFLRSETVSKVPPFGYLEEYPVLSATLPEANFPMDVIPEGLTFCGPVILERAAAVDQDVELVQWLKHAGRKTVVINLGTIYQHDPYRARVMAEALAEVLAVTDEFQFLWKLPKNSGFDEGKELNELAPVKEHLKKGTVRIQTWLEIDTVTLLQMDSVVLFVNHGGGNSYHEGVLAGVPQLFLPLWFDCYNYASLGEYLGIGIWAGSATAPHWHTKPMVKDFLRALVGEESLALRKRATELGFKAKAYGGRQKAAKEVARGAGLGV
ncbi:hypothetical protein B0I35DRAFT_443845 [Stachybotrys elegans]|uniref:Glycosyltransferase family 1 protein n=1 Tax=Stachybotrys elegans TaxID=80388 RepID=A0A8K0SG65_9HYPO|nr:hypothetical protein B0I35DRAFT_443845 [Stachybotrys elegans]